MFLYKYDTHYILSLRQSATILQSELKINLPYHTHYIVLEDKIIPDYIVHLKYSFLVDSQVYTKVFLCLFLVAKIPQTMGFRGNLPSDLWLFVAPPPNSGGGRACVKILVAPYVVVIPPFILCWSYELLSARTPHPYIFSSCHLFDVTGIVSPKAPYLMCTPDVFIRVWV